MNLSIPTIDEWTILVCPACRVYVPFSAMDQVHGGRPVCSCTASSRVDDSGFSVFVGHTDTVAVQVVPVDPDWNDKPRSLDKEE